ncbi:MAG: triose-phosphate isomerase [Bdellovibrionota bacterium]|nr:MAG: triose-phosphate isomerase [Bdellovibrionota bacterium]
MGPLKESQRSSASLVVCNWKAYLGIEESVTLARNALALARSHATALWIAPSMLSLGSVAQAVRGSMVAVGAQNCFWDGKGAFTGECTADELIELGCTFAIVGHSERRNLFGETSASAAKRAHALLRSGLGVICCVGESAHERAQGHTLETILEQLAPLFPAPLARPGQMIIAYEPVWSVGSGQTPTASQIHEVHELIKTHAAQHVENLRVLYGGSVTAANAAELARAPSVAGFLVGGASTKLDSLKALLDTLG